MPREKTYRYNLYKIPKEKEGGLIANLKEKGLSEVGRRTCGSYTVAFYLCDEPDKVKDIWWAEQYGEFIPEDKKDTIFNLAHSAAILYSSSQNCFAIPLGKTHFYFRDFADLDFGIDLACRIADEGSVGLVNSRSFGGNKTKTIATFSADSRLDIDSGESLEYLKASLIDKETWGKNGNFGASASLCLKVAPDQLNEALDRIVTTLQQPELFQPPRSTEEKSPTKKASLDQKLGDIIAGKVTGDTSVEVASIQLSGVEFIFSETHHFVLKGPNRISSERIESLDIESLRSFASENSLDLSISWQDIKVQHADEQNIGHFTNPLKKEISYVTPEDGEFYFLRDGKWYRFSEKYIEALLTSIEQIELTPYLSDLNLDRQAFQRWVDQNPDTNLKYTEWWYNNEVLGKQPDMEVYDRQSISGTKNYSVEPLDVLDKKTDTFIFVKRWTKSSDFAYLIDQAITSIKLLNASNTLPVGDETLQCKNAKLLLITNKEPVTSLRNIRSLIVLQKLNAFKSECRRKNINPFVQIQQEV